MAHETSNSKKYSFTNNNTNTDSIHSRDFFIHKSVISAAKGDLYLHKPVISATKGAYTVVFIQFSYKRSKGSDC